MVSLKGNTVFLRALESEDLAFLYKLENDPAMWEISGTLTPFSKDVLKNYLDNAHRDIFEAKQLRLCICDSQGKAIGFVDLFDFDPHHQRAGIGLVILEEGERNKGAGTEAVQLMVDYTFSHLRLKQLFANVLAGNEASIHLFHKLGFQMVGTKKDWIYGNDGFKDEIMFQKINSKCT
ncbi:MAG: GNAT family N-acetyltransferase [Sediminicola sp.]|tara:strand:+ start:15878 stop:16411 length:534 start_codon:yes stop_codon:yes gene_type:complete